MGRTDRRRAVAVVSGGLDSVVSLAAGLETHDVRLVLFFDYGQRARASERASVIAVVSYYQLPLREVDVRWLGSLSPAGMRAGADESAGELRTLDEVWIPNRNGVFLNVAAAFAESYGCDLVLAGFNREEAVEFPDNAPAFVACVNEALAHSTRGRVEVASPTQDLDKREILWRGIELGAPLSLIWSCYRSGERMCGRCASCRRLRVALDAVPEERRPPIVFEDS